MLSLPSAQGNELPGAAEYLLGLIDVLIAPPYNARQIMVLRMLESLQLVILYWDTFLQELLSLKDQDLTGRWC